MNTKPRCILFALLTVAVMVLMILPACSDSPQDAFSIYHLKGDNRDGQALSTNSEKELKPWLIIDDIESYDYSAHNIYLKKGITLATLTGLDPVRSLWGKRFIVVVNGEDCYTGYFYSAASSAFPPEIPIIWTPQFYPEDVIHIAKAGFRQGNEQPDVRFDERIRSALEKSGRLDLGLSVRLVRAEYTSTLEGNQVSYTLRITNNGNSTLYFPDPDKIEIRNLIYYTNGLGLCHGRDSYYARFDSLNSLLQWQKEWYTPLMAGWSVNRTIVQLDFPFVPDGQYICKLLYGGPHMIEKPERRLAEGKIWIGEIEVEPLEITVQR